MAAPSSFPIAARVARSEHRHPTRPRFADRAPHLCSNPATDAQLAPAPLHAQAATWPSCHCFSQAPAFIALPVSQPCRTTPLPFPHPRHVPSAHLVGHGVFFSVVFFFVAGSWAPNPVSLSIPCSARMRPFLAGSCFSKPLAPNIVGCYALVMELTSAQPPGLNRHVASWRSSPMVAPSHARRGWW